MSDTTEPPDLARVHTPHPSDDGQPLRTNHYHALKPSHFSQEAQSAHTVRYPIRTRKNRLQVFAPLLVICCFLISALTTASATVLPPSSLNNHAPRNDDALDALPPVSARSNASPHGSVHHDDTASLKARSFDLASFLDHQSYPTLQRDDAADLINKLLALRSSPAPISQYLVHRSGGQEHQSNEHYHTYAKREELSTGQKVGYGIIVPVLVILSGIFAGLTLGYMSLDETQLQVLSTTGTEKQRAYARKIIPIRKDGHLLLTTLLVANMITNETLPIVSDPLFPTPVLAVVISTILVIIFSELVPQSVCSRYGLEIGAYMAMPTRVIIIILYPIGWPVSRILHLVLGPHHGIVYRRAELKELVTMHAAAGGRGGDLKGDTVMMVGGALDLQEKVAKQAMTPMDSVFMLPFEAKLDYPTLERVVRSGHSRIPIYQEIEVAITPKSGAATPSKKGVPGLFNALTRRGTANSSKQLLGEPGSTGDAAAGKGEKGSASNGTNSPKFLSPASPPNSGTETIKRKKIIGTLLVKSCVLLDPEDAVPVSDMTINAVPTVPHDEPLLNVLNAFQEGRSHMAIVTSLSRDLSTNDTQAAAEAISSTNNVHKGSTGPRTDGLSDIDEERQLDTSARQRTSTSSSRSSDSENQGFRGFFKKHFGHDDAPLEQTAPSDAELSEKTAFDEILKPGRGENIGIITLEDVLEELIGEEIYDEYDPRENEDGAWNNVTPPMSPELAREKPAAEAPPQIELSLPPATLQDSNTAPGAPGPQSQQSKTLLGRLGLAGRSKGAAASKESSMPTIESPGPIETVAAPEAAADPSSQDQDPASGTSTTVDASPVESRDYFGGGTKSTSGDARPTETTVESSATTESAPSQSGILRFGSLPAGGNATTGGPVFAPSANRPAQPGVAQPQPSRPVVIRKQNPGGGHSNVIVGEHLLRGRRPTPGTPVGSVPPSLGAAGNAGGAAPTAAGVAAAAVAGGDVSCSSTPRPNRFKSTPVQHSLSGTGFTATSPNTATAAVLNSARARSQSSEPRRGLSGSKEDGSSTPRRAASGANTGATTPTAAAPLDVTPVGSGATEQEAQHDENPSPLPVESPQPIDEGEAKQ